MAPSAMTNYAEIQEDEIQALRSIYMDDFQEERPKVGAWNKSSDRAFRIVVKPAAVDGEGIALTFRASLPATYPKTLPKLSVEFSENVRPTIRAEAERVLRTKPKTLLGTEMVFEITSSLQDILDQALQTKAESIPTLDEERANQQAIITQQARRLQEEKEKEKLQASVEEEQYLQEMVDNQKAREAKRRIKLQTWTSQDPEPISMYGSVQFDQPAAIKDPQGNELAIDAVHDQVAISEGPVTKVWLVRHVGATVASNFFLVLKECHVPVLSDETSLKKQIQNLESKLERLTHLATHPNIARPLAFRIERSEMTDTTKDQGWNVFVLMENAGRGSLYDLLEMTGPLDPAIGRAWAMQLFEGLGHLHRRGLIHARVHTNNILLEKIETGRVVARLSDGGYQHDLYLLRGHDATNHAGAASAYWIAPEIVSDSASSQSPAADIWALGVVILQIFFGLDIQSKHQSPAALMDSSSLSPSFERMLRSMFQYETKKRPSAWELVSSAFLRNDGSLYYETPVESPSNKRSQRRGSTHLQPSASRFETDFIQEGRLGKGGYGSVVKARNRLDSNFYAVKIINKCTEAALDKVLNEVRLLSQLNHPNVVRYYTAWKEVDSPITNVPHDDSSDKTSSSGEDEEISDLIFPRSSGGLDFIGSNNDKLFSDDESTEDETNGNAFSDDGIVFGEDDEEASDEPRRNSNSSREIVAAPPIRRQSSSQTNIVNNTLYIQMEYCEKKTLRDVIRSGIYDEVEEAWRYLRQILQGLVHIHSASIVHRDLKPENIFIDSNSNVRIGDFGLARPGEFLQVSTKGTNPSKDSRNGYGNFTRSIGTTFYVAPEVKSTATTSGNYDEKADMFSLGIIFFEMNYRLETGMERVHTLVALCKADSAFPAAFSKDPEKVKQGQLILSLVNHNPNLRPSSSDLLRSGLVPVQTEDELMRAALRALSGPASEFRTQLISTIIAEATLNKNSSEPASLLKGYMYDLHGWTSPDICESLLRKAVKDHLTSIFRRHGAVEADRPALLPFSAHYAQHESPVYKVIDSDGVVLQMPLDLTLPYARILAKHPSPSPKTYNFGEVFRAARIGGHPTVVGEVDFDIVSYNSLDLALREAEVIKVLDEIVDELPSMAAVQMCYHINHSVVLDAVLDASDIPSSKRSAVKEVISRLHTGDHTWATIRSELRNPPISVPATSVEELVTFDFRDTCDKALSRLRLMFRATADLESTFSHLQAVSIYLERFNVKRKAYINPLVSYNEKFYRGNFLFQCVYDSKKKNVFAAGGRYDQLIKEHQLIQNPSSSSGHRADDSNGNTPNITNCHAVGFNLSWRDLHRSMVRYHKGSTKRTPKAKKDLETNSAWPQIRRCDVLIDSFDKNLLRTTGLHAIQELWACGIHAELALSQGSDLDHKVSSAYSLNQDTVPYLYLVNIKHEGAVKVRNVTQNEDTEMRTSELNSWFKSEMIYRERTEDYGRKFSRYHSHSEQGTPSVETGSNVQVLTASNKGKKTNRRAIIEEAFVRCQEFMHGLSDGNVEVVAIETKDDIFEGIRETRLGDADSWKKFIQHAPAGERMYLQEVHELLKSKAAKAKTGYRSAFLYNFRTGGCIWYDLGHAP
ncbi:MAG: hypothetical protein L6R38_005099 [Xanthoria sp. 2 TBL-2021]|nr:MAG: hypothetical protein L6R38_005099 [Xanthoria sp. 2 TBL-2021]